MYGKIVFQKLGHNAIQIVQSDCIQGYLIISVSGINKLLT